MFREILDAVLKSGLRVSAIITDSMAKNKVAMMMLGACGERPWFFLNECKIFCIFDVPHLLKALRNAILKYYLRLKDGSLVKFEYIRQFVEMDMTMTPRMAKKITKTHPNPNNFEKMSVPLASQLLSNTTAIGVLVYAMLGELPPEAAATGKFVAKINDLFDSWNGIEVIDNPETDMFKCACTDKSHHEALWEEMYEEMAHWDFIGCGP